MKEFVFVALVLTTMLFSDQYAYTTDGAQVVLRDNGTWEYTKSESEFYICERWEDKNQDGRVGLTDELVGEKNAFRVGKDQDITFAAVYYSKKGLVALTQICKPNGESWRRFTETLSFRDNVSHKAYKIKEMYQEGGKGEWVVKWYLNETLVAMRYFEIDD